MLPTVEFTAIWHSLVPVVGIYMVYWTGSLWIDYRRKCDRFRDLPGYRTWFGIGGAVAFVLGIVIPGYKGRMLHLLNKWKMYEHSGCDVHSAISMLPHPRNRYYIADPKVIKEIGANRLLFLKPIEHYKVLLFFGKNIIASEGSLWKKYRKLSAPAFSTRNNRLVWEESISLVDDMALAKPDWKGRDIVDVDNPLSFTMPIALSIISAAGFGQQMRFSTAGVLPTGHSMTFPEALQIVSDSIFLRAVVPDWFPNLTKGLGRVRMAFSELRAYMEDMIRERRSTGKKEQQFDLFSGLLDNLDGYDEEMHLDDGEIIGNVFIFLIAGHETTAHTLAYAFGLLAFFQGEQELLYQHIKEICGDRDPCFDDMPKLTRSLAVFYETLRMFPSVAIIPKRTAESTTIVTSTIQGDPRPIPLEKGADLLIHVAGLHYNPRYWKDPSKFDPSRFLDVNWPKDAFIPFSVGHRSCMGRPFAETEAVAVITAMMLRYKVDLQDSFVHSTKGMITEERFDKLFESRNLLTLTPKRMPLRFLKR